MNKMYIIVLVLLLCFGVSRESHALRCGNKIILEGDFILKVLKNCGKPIFSDFMMYRNHLTKMMVYKKDGRDQIIYLRNNFVIEVL